MKQEMSITVTDPTKKTDKYEQFISYKVNSNIARSGFAAGPITVERRYSDFSWLSSALAKEFPGAIIPPLPEKLTLGRFSSEFVESRRRALERFLSRILLHPDLGNAQSFCTFLQGDESSFGSAKDETKNANKQKLSSTTAMAWLEGTVNTLTVGKPDLEKTAADTKVEEISQYISQLEKQLSNATKHAEILVKRNKDLSQALFEFAQSVSVLGQAEGDAIGTGLSMFGSTLDNISIITGNHAETEAMKFLEPLEDYVRVIASIKSAISQRTEKKNSYLASLADVEAKSNAHRKLIGVAGKETQAKQKEDAVQMAQEASDVAKQEFEKVTERLLTEFELFKVYKANDLKQYVVDFVKLQIDYNNACESAWKEALPKLMAVAVPSLDSSNQQTGFSPKVASFQDSYSHFHEEDESAGV